MTSIRAKNVVFGLVREDNFIPKLVCFVFVLVGEINTFLSIDFINKRLLASCASIVPGFFDRSTYCIRRNTFVQRFLQLCSYLRSTCKWIFFIIASIFLLSLLFNFGGRPVRSLFSILFSLL